MFPTLLRRMAKEPLKEGLENITRRVPLTIANNTYRARKVWPPDFKGLTPQQQLRFEKKWKRRLGLASHSPKWIKGLKYAQLLTVTIAIIWLFFFAEFEWWGQTYKPSEEMRNKVVNVFGVFDPEKRYERRKDAPLPPPPKNQPGSTEEKDAKSE